MNQFITVKKNDADFLKLLWGSYSKSHVGLPVKTLNLGAVDETITFELVDKNIISKPSKLTIFLSLIKFQYLFLIILPLFYVLTKNYADNRFFDPESCMIASVAMLFLFAAFNIRNDVNDHLSGYDRVNMADKPKPIQLGWITAESASRLSWLFIFLSALLAVPVMIYQPEEIRVIAVVFVLILIGQLLTKNSYKNQHWGEIIFFIIIGPGVLSGYQVALGAGIDTEVLAFGVLWAWGIQFLVHLNNFSHLLTSSQAGIKNTMTKAGFDQAKKIILLWWIAFIGLWIAYHYFYARTFWSFVTSGILIFWSIPTLIRISEIQSPVGSDLIEAKRVGYRNFLLMCFLIVLEFYWYLGAANNWFI